MVDSVEVFDPSFRVTDANGAPVNGAKIKFFEVGPGATKTVYSDKGLTVPLGVIVYTRSDGYPVVSQGSNTTTLIFVGNTPYYVVVTDANDVPIFPAKDNVRGAVDTSSFLTAGSTLNIPMVSTAIDLTLNATHKGKLIAASAACVLTAQAAATLLDGWNCKIRNDSAAARVVFSSSDTIHALMGSVSAFAIGPGAAIEVTCNGASFEITNLTPPYFVGADVLAIASRVNAVPGGPIAGARYIATGVFAAGVVTTAVGDIIEANGMGNWFKITPPTDAGWLAFVQDENQYYSFQDSAWKNVFPQSSDTVPGLIELAVQSEMVTATDVVRAVSPGRQQYHPGHPKAHGFASGAGALHAGSYGIASIAKNSTGNYTVTLATAMADANGTQAGGVLGDGLTWNAVYATATTITVTTFNASTLAAQDSAFWIAAFGTQ